MKEYKGIMKDMKMFQEEEMTSSIMTWLCDKILESIKYVHLILQSLFLMISRHNRKNCRMKKDNLGAVAVSITAADLESMVNEGLLED